ncbi:MAG: phosphate ABC transporter permease PstA [Actinobacteria bacterium]|nr:phosphate ABC transporter permease PstA [Actinomycetota bacterium]MSX98855.1 phosphate ABC transporter permease PstA [Actinomycetota bacterium]MSZ98498.1 phosphate ABC transporter permease PstA [Actinomycetota bacterium]
MPTTPWKRTRGEQLGTVVTFLISALAAAFIVLVTGLAGVDGWAFTFLIIFLLVTTVRAFKADAKVRKEMFVSVAIFATAALAFTPWMSIFASVVLKGARGFKPNFFVGDMRTTIPDDELNLGGAGHAIVGSIMMVLNATIITLPLGILSGVYLTEVRGRLTFLVRFVVQSMSGVPSIVAGLFIYTTFVNYTNSFSGLAGSFALAILMLPTVARTAEEVLKLVPDDLRSASYALGARQWRTSLMVVLPTVRSGLTTAAILGVARVIGETAPLLLTSLSSNSFVFNPLGGPIGSLPTYVFGLLQIGTENAINRAWTGALVLMLLVLALFTTARFIGGKDRR